MANWKHLDSESTLYRNRVTGVVRKGFDGRWYAALRRVEETSLGHHTTREDAMRVVEESLGKVATKPAPKPRKPAKRAGGATAIAATIPPLATIDPTGAKVAAMNQAIVANANAQGLPVANVWNAISQAELVASDGVHPGPAGYARIAAVVSAAIDAIASKPVAPAVAADRSSILPGRRLSCGCARAESAKVVP